MGPRIFSNNHSSYYQLYESIPKQGLSKYLENGQKHCFKLQYSGPRILVIQKTYVQLLTIGMFFWKKYSFGRSNIWLILTPPPSPSHAKWRMAYQYMITHLSYRPSLSINKHIDPQFTTVTYTSIDTVVQTIRTLFPRALIVKLDIKMLFAFCQFTQGTLNFQECTLIGLITLTNAYPLIVQYRANYLKLSDFLRMGCQI